MALQLVFILGVSAVIVKFIWSTFIYPVFLSPLSKIPAAHPLSRLTNLWITYIRWTKLEIRTIHHAHERLGPVILLGPTEISVNCVKGGIQTIYSGGFEKGDWYDIFSNYGGVRNMFSLPWSKPHGARKRMLSNVYSKSFLQTSPTLKAVTEEILYRRMLPRFAGLAEEGKPFDIYSELSALTMDFVTGYQFGLAHSSNFVQDVGFREKFLDWYTSRIGFNFWPQECPTVTAVLEKAGLQMVPPHVGPANQNIERWCLAMCDEATTFLRTTSVPKTNDLEETIADFPVVFSQLMTAMEKSKDYPQLDSRQRKLEIASEMLDHLAAGFDTSGITLCYFVHELSQRPDAQARLRKELSSLDPPLLVEQTYNSAFTVQTAKQLDALPYLEASLQETLRLRSAIPGPEPRITPPEGCMLGPAGEYADIPGGVRISAQAHSLHRNREVYERPDEWIPERWLDSSEGKLREMRRWFWAFGSGGRMCVGSNLALYQMKFIIAAIYTNFTTSIVDDVDIQQMGLYTAPPSSGRLIVRIRVADK